MLIRTALISDAQEISRLSGELGYAAEASQMAERLRYLTGQSDNIVYVADAGGQLVGWIHAEVRFLVESPSFVEISGLVVDSAHRGEGIGRELITQCEEWAARTGFTKLRVRTNQTRSDAVQFYNRLGFATVKSQHVMDKIVG
ncbi:acetyltransferase [compost metagenome]